MPRNKAEQQQIGAAPRLLNNYFPAVRYQDDSKRYPA